MTIFIGLIRWTNRTRDDSQSHSNSEYYTFNPNESVVFHLINFKKLHLPCRLYEKVLSHDYYMIIRMLYMLSQKIITS